MQNAIHLRWLCGIVCLALSGDNGAVAADAKSPQDSVAATVIHPDWSAAVIASEPTIIDPVAIRVDRHHRIWVVEMADYPTGPAEGQSPRGRIRILEDRDHDGQFEHATTFADQLLFPTGVQPWRNGAIVTLAGKIVWLEDKDDDSVADHTAVWFEGFAMDNEQLRANHPILGPDGMVYVAGGLRGGRIRTTDPRFDASVGEVDLRDRDFCFDPDGGDWKAVTGNSQFGLTIDDFGRRIGCSNRNPAMYSILDNGAIARDSMMAPSAAIENIAVSGEASRVVPRAVAWTTSNLHAGQFSAACGVSAPGWFKLKSTVDGERQNASGGEWLLVCEPTAYLIQRQWLATENGVWRSKREDRAEEFMSSQDTWFRPVDLVAGPEQSVLVADMYRAVIEHPDWVPQELKNRPDTWNGNDRGRIWKLQPKRTVQADPTGSPDASWLGHPNPWIREVASQYFHESETNTVIASLNAALQEQTVTPNAVARISQWLSSRDLITKESIKKILGHHDVRVVALGSAICQSNAELSQAATESLLSLSRNDDPIVRLAVGSSLAARPLETPKAAEAVVEIARRDGHTEAARKILGSVDSSYIPELCRRTIWQMDVSTLLASHWWTRWAALAPDESLAHLVEQASPKAGAMETENRLIAIFESWLNGNRSAGGKGKSMEAMKSVVTGEPGDALRKVSETVATDRNRPSGIRVAAVRVSVAMGQLPDSFWTLVDDVEPMELRNEALTAWFHRDVTTTCEWLEDRVLGFPPGVRARAIELLVSNPESTRWLFDRIEAGKYKPSLVQPQQGDRLMQSSDQQIAARAKALFSISADRAQTIARYQSADRFSDALRGADAIHGKQIFAQTCAACHAVDGVGVNVGPDISDSRDKTPEAILTSILNPNAAIDAAYLHYAALTTDGRVLEGLLIDDRSEGVTLRRQGGLNVFIPRDELDRLQASGASLMPDGFERLINESDMADLVAYLKNWRYLRVDSLQP